MLCAHLSDTGAKFGDYPNALEAFFTYVVKSQLKQRIAFSDCYAASALPGATGEPMEVFDPVNPENNVASGYSDHARKKIVDAAEEALESLSEARFAMTKERAVDCWRQVLGPSFMR
jgi:tRNA nucleotidyltransferase (CCA-adding enzyme)